jgi:Integrase core domain
MANVAELVPVVGVTASCQAIGVARASFYRHERRHVELPKGSFGPSPRDEGAAGERSEQIAPGQSSVEALGVPSPPPSTNGSPTVVTRVHPRALSVAEQQTVREVLHSPRFQDAAPAAVYATLLDEGTYHASERTMYRLLAAEGETRPRRDQLVHPTYQKPELLATAPNQVWSWDITKLLGPAKWTYFYLYVILDVYSRYVVGWMVAHREQADLAECLIAETIAKQEIPAGQLTLHADRGSSMTSKPVAFLLADLGVTKSHSRPYAVQDPQVSARLPRPLRLSGRGPNVLPAILPLVQRRAPTLGHRPAAAPGRSLRPRPGRLRCSLPRPRCRSRRSSRALRPPGAAPASAPHRRLDQPAHPGHQLVRWV